MTYTDDSAKAFLRKRYAACFGDAGSNQAADHFGSASPNQAARSPFAVFVSAPGRVELAGNHTDHQGGYTISAAIGQRAYALAAPNGTNVIHACMDGFGEASVRLDDLEPRTDERGTPVSLIRGMAAAYARSGNPLYGFDMVTCSDIPVGCGLSSSAAFEVLVGTTIRALYDPAVQAAPADLTALALESVEAEHTYFGKPCGAQDQLTSAYGGIVCIDFASALPRVVPLAFDLSAYPYALYLIDSRCDHSLFTDEYAAVPADMRAVAQHFGCDKLEDLPYQTFLGQLFSVRRQLGDRAALRALHYFEETLRVKAQVEALRRDCFEEFLTLVRLSGASSAQFLQNVSPRTDDRGASQPAMVILALCAHLLDGVDGAQKELKGAYRIHGGGFGGSVLAFVPSQTADSFQASMDDLLGYEGCMTITVDSRGASIERLS